MYYHKQYSFAPEVSFCLSLYHSISEKFEISCLCIQFLNHINIFASHTLLLELLVSQLELSHPILLTVLPSPEPSLIKLNHLVN